MNMTICESVRKGIAFIEENLNGSIGVNDVAKHVSYSQFYFSREFSKHTHISVYDYILRRKLSESYKKLFQSGLKIVDLAFMYGFQSHEVYTRAFRKMFGENPSEAAVYKPLAVFEAIDDQYLAFLHHLSVDVLDGNTDELYFEVDTAAGFDSSGSFLIQLSEHLLACGSIFKGRTCPEENCRLSFALKHLKRKIRIRNTNAEYSFRYFIDHFYEAGEMSGNYILLNREQDHIDILIPCKT
jgi:AraC-like DNA-binding protein